MPPRRARAVSHGPDKVARAFEPLRADRTRGAQALASAALNTIASLLDGWSGVPPSRLPPLYRAVARSLERAQPAMGPFLHWAQEWRRLARAGAPGGRFRAARAWLRRERSHMRSEGPRLARIALGRFPANTRHVVTLSRSRTVLLALAALPRHQRPSRVSVLESLPGGEGRGFAYDLRHAGFSARVIPDRTGPAVVRGADLLLIGADAVFSDGSVVHKTGTRELAQAASRSHVPVVVVAGVSKFTERPAPRRRLPDLFDRTPSRYISEFWTDRGVRSGGWRARPSRRPPPQ